MYFESNYRGRGVRKYAPGDTESEQQEIEAREAQRGLWADPHPAPPWEWRKWRERP